MKTHTSKRASWLKGLLVLPLLAVLIYGFSETKQEFITSEMAEQKTETYIISENIDIELRKDKSIYVNNKLATFKTLPSVLSTFNAHLTKEQREDMVVASIKSNKSIPMGFIFDLKQVLVDYGISRMEIPGELYSDGEGNSSIKDVSIDFNAKNYYSLEQASLTELSFYNRIAKKYNEQDIENRKITPEDFILINAFYKKMSLEQKENNTTMPKFLQKNIPNIDKKYYQNLLNKEERDADGWFINNKPFTLQIELSKLRLNGVPVKLADFTKAVDKVTKDWDQTDYSSAHPNVLIASTPKAFLDKVEAKFSKTKFFKANGRIGIIPPPPPPTPPTTPKVLKGQASQLPPPPPPPANMGDVKKKYEYSYVLYINGDESIYLEGKKVPLNKFAKAMDAHTKSWPASAYKLYGVSKKRENVSEDFIKKLNKEYQKTKLAKKSSKKQPFLFAPAALNLPPPPPPPPGPEKPLEHVIAMAKRNATFYFEMIDVAPEAAIKMVRKNPGLHIETVLNDPNPPKVYLSHKFINQQDQNPKYETIASIKAMKADEPKSGYFLLKGETFFFVKEGIDIKYFNKWGNQVNEKGEKIIIAQQNKNPKYETITSIKAMKADEQKSGYFLLNGKTFFFTKEGEKIQYYNKWGNLVNEKGEKITVSPFKQEQQKLNKSGFLNNSGSKLFSVGDEGIKTTKQYKFPNDTKDAAHALKVISNFEERNPKFSFEGKTITATEAKSILKKNPTYNLNVTEYATSFKKRVEIEIIPE